MKYGNIKDDIEKRLNKIKELNPQKGMPASGEKLVHRIVLRWYLRNVGDIPEEIKKKVTEEAKKRGDERSDQLYGSLLHTYDKEAFEKILEIYPGEFKHGFYESLETSIVEGNNYNFTQLISYSPQLAIEPFVDENASYSEQKPITALILAAKHNRLDAVQTLLSIPESNNHINFEHDSRTALYWAQQNKNQEMAKLLIQNGATPLPEFKEKEKENNYSNVLSTKKIAAPPAKDTSDSHPPHLSDAYKERLQEKIPVKNQKISKLNTILKDYLEDRRNNRQKPQGIPIKTEQYLNWKIPLVGHFFQKSFKEKEAAVLALQSALDILEGKGKETNDTVNLHDHLSILRNGELGNQIRTFIRNKHAEGIVDEKVETVTQFITALQERISEKLDENKDDTYGF